MTGAGELHGGRKVREGIVVSDKTQKTVLVAVEYRTRHPLYRKTVRRTRRFMAHDEREEAHTGDRVRIVESSPISRRKRWRVIEVLLRAELPEVAPESIDLDLLGEVKPEEETAPEPAPKRAAVKEAPAAAVSAPEIEAAEPPAEVEIEEAPPAGDVAAVEPADVEPVEEAPPAEEAPVEGEAEAPPPAEAAAATEEPAAEEPPAAGAPAEDEGEAPPPAEAAAVTEEPAAEAPAEETAAEPYEPAAAEPEEEAK